MVACKNRFSSLTLFTCSMQEVQPLLTIMQSYTDTAASPFSLWYTFVSCIVQSNNMALCTIVLLGNNHCFSIFVSYRRFAKRMKASPVICLRKQCNFQSQLRLLHQLQQQQRDNNPLPQLKQ